MEWGVVAASGGFALAGVALGYGFRVREVVRTDRRHLYVNFIGLLDQWRATRGGAATESFGTFEKVGASLVMAEVELSLIASPRVYKSASAFVDELYGREMLALLEQARAGEVPFDEWVDRSWALIRDARAELVNLMRQDLWVPSLSGGRNRRFAFGKHRDA